MGLDSVTPARLEALHRNKELLPPPPASTSDLRAPTTSLPSANTCLGTKRNQYSNKINTFYSKHLQEEIIRPYNYNVYSNISFYERLSRTE